MLFVYCNRHEIKFILSYLIDILGICGVAGPKSPAVGNWWFSSKFYGNGWEFESETCIVDGDGYFLQRLGADVRLFLERCLCVFHDCFRVHDTSGR